jgi:hypothetical protein
MFLIDRPLPSHDVIERLMSQARQDRSDCIADRTAAAASAVCAALGPAVGALLRGSEALLFRRRMARSGYAVATGVLVIAAFFLVAPGQMRPVPEGLPVPLNPLELVPDGALPEGEHYEAY